jgi:hypothetical protein
MIKIPKHRRLALRDATFLALLLLISPGWAEAKDNKGAPVENFTIPAPASFKVPAPRVTNLSIDLRKPVEPVNRRVMGVCLMYPPFDPELTSIFQGVLDGTSGRAWAHLTTDEHWLGFMPFVRDVGIKELFAYDSHVRLETVARYNSAGDNNLTERQQAQMKAHLVQKLNLEPHPGFPDGFGITGWEIWNEPWAHKNGLWPAADLARFAIDCSKAIRGVEPTMQIGVPLFEGLEDAKTRNRALLHHIAAADVTAVDFVVTHPYSFSWFQASEEFGTYYARVSDVEAVRDHVRDAVQLALELGRGHWRVVCTEWTVHPPKIEPRYADRSIDMAAAINMAAMFGVFWEEGVDSAQVFELFGPPSHAPELTEFHLVSKTDTGLRVNPTGELLRLYGRYFRGDRYEVLHNAPAYEYRTDGKSYTVPLVIAHACHDAVNERAVFLLTNRHIDQAASVEVKLDNFRSSGVGRCITLSAEGPESTQPVIRESMIRAEKDSVSRGNVAAVFNISLPPHSTTAVVLDGAIPPTDAEFFSQRLLFIENWAVGQVMAPIADAPRRGLSAPLPASVETPEKAVQADRFGYVNLAEVGEKSGAIKEIGEGYQALATSWVFSPDEREVQLSLGLDYWGSLMVNDRTVLTVDNRRGGPSQDSHRAKATLRAGWNKVQVRVSSGQGGMGFWMAIENLKDYQFSAALQQPPWPEQWTITANRGTFVIDYGEDRDRNYEGRDTLEISPSPLRRAYLRWPTAPLPSGVSADQATFQLSLHRAFGKGSGKVYIRPILQDWDASDMTFSRGQPKLGPRLQVEADLSDEYWIFSGESLAIMREWFVDPAKNYGLAIECEGQIPVYGAITFSNPDPQKCPRLEVKLEAP